MAAEVLASFVFIKFRKSKMSLEEEYVIYKKLSMKNNKSSSNDSKLESTTDIELFVEQKPIIKDECHCNEESKTSKLDIFDDDEQLLRMEERERDSSLKKK